MRNRNWGKHLKRDKMLETYCKMKEQEGGHQTVGLAIIPTLPFIIMKIMMKVKWIMKAPTSNHNDESEDGLYQVATRVFTSCET